MSLTVRWTSWAARLSRLPSPSLRLQRVVAVLALVSNAGIAVTGSIVRLTGSGLGCSTWPGCTPDSLVPVAHPELGQFHQWIEYGNRMLGVLVSVVAGLCVVSALLAKPRRRRVLLLSLTMLGGVVAQAVIGGLTVLAELVWWTVALHLIASTPLVWAAVLLVRAIDEGDAPPRSLANPAARGLLVALTVTLGAVVVAGTMVTGAGPHAGDERVARLTVPIEVLAHTHAALMYVFLGLLIALGVLLRVDPRGGAADRGIWWRYLVLLGVVLAQGLIGLVQFLTNVPPVLVSFHVLGAMLVIAATAALWCAIRDRGPRIAHHRAPAVEVDVVERAQPAAV